MYGQSMRQRVAVSLAALFCLAASGLAGARAEDGPSVPDGLRVWNAAPLDHVLDRKFGAEAPALKPLRMAAARGGVGSGQVVATDGGGLAKLEARLSPLLRKGGTATIPAAAVAVRFGARATPADAPTWTHVPYHPILRTRPPAAAVVPVWVTVDLPSRFFVEQMKRAAPYATWVVHAHNQERDLHG